MIDGDDLSSVAFFDQLPQPVAARSRLVECCPRCGEPGVLYTFAYPGRPPQVHLVHRTVDCPDCGEEHPLRICVIPTFPPTPGMRGRVSVCSVRR